jgi:menaquinol-cytochrome c reductase cytochrome b/c subunit
MTEIPEHLRKRAEQARAKAAEAASAEATPADTASADTGVGASGAVSSASSAGDPNAGRIPAHLLERSKSARSQAEGGAAAAGGGVGTAVATTSVAAVAAATATAPGVPVGAGPGGHTQRLLTVVKSGSIQDVKATPIDKVHTWPHLLLAEFVASVGCTAFLLVFSTFVNAPLQRLANPNQTPNPSKAPWYFLGLQELLTMFHPMVAGVTIPGMGLFALMLAPYIDRNPSNKPEDRKFAISIFTIFMMFWAVLVIIGSFFRGPGFNFVFPWRNGIFFEF